MELNMVGTSLVRKESTHSLFVLVLISPSLDHYTNYFYMVKRKVEKSLDVFNTVKYSLNGTKSVHIF